MSKRIVTATFSNSGGVLARHTMEVSVGPDGWFADDQTTVADAVLEMIKETGMHMMPGDTITITEEG